MDEKQLIKEQFCIKWKVQYMYEQMSPYLSTFLPLELSNLSVLSEFSLFTSILLFHKLDPILVVAVVIVQWTL